MNHTDLTVLQQIGLAVLCLVATAVVLGGMAVLMVQSTPEPEGRRVKSETGIRSERRAS